MAKHDESVAEEPLLPAGRVAEYDGGGGGLSAREEVKRQLWLAGPLIAGALLQNLIQMISVMYVGHLGELALAGASMASSFATVTGFSLLCKNLIQTPVAQGKQSRIGYFVQHAVAELQPGKARAAARALPTITCTHRAAGARRSSASSLSSTSPTHKKKEYTTHGNVWNRILTRERLFVLGFEKKSPRLGMASALDTLCGQAFGARQYHLLGIYKQRAMLILTLVSIPLAVVWFYTREILLLFGQDPDIAMEAGTYARWMIPVIFAYGLLQCHVRFLQTQNIVLPVMAGAGAAAAFHLLVCWLLVYVAGMGSKGAALSNAISYWIYVIILAVYVRVSSSCKKTWTGFSAEAFHDLLSFFTLAVPSALMVCLEMWSFELIVLLSGLLPNPKLETSVLSISLNTAAFVWMIPFGLGSAISTRVSNEVGAGRPNAARLAVRVVVFLAIAEGLIMGLVLICIRYVWGRAYSDVEEVVTYVAQMMLIISVSNFFDGIQCVLSGVARGCGWQKIGAWINLSAYYIVGIPSAYIIAFVLHVGGTGLWLGIICGLMVQVLLLMAITICTDWDKEAAKAKNRVYSSSLPTDFTT